MILNLFLLCLYLFPLSASALSGEERQHIVDEHNRFRREAGAADMLMMEYDPALECVAQAYIETQTGSFTHNPNRATDYAACGGSGSVGENWYSGHHADATDQWANLICCGNTCGEKDVFIGTAGCTGITGHYTQIMWATSYKVGCGWTAGGGTVCNYAPAGNFGGQDPWEGAPSLNLGNSCDNCDLPPINNTHPYCFNELCSRTSDGSTPGRGGSDISEMNQGAAYFLLILFGCLLCTTVLVVVVAVIAVVVALVLGTGGTVALTSGVGGKL